MLGRAAPGIFTAAEHERGASDGGQLGRGVAPGEQGVLLGRKLGGAFALDHLQDVFKQGQVQMRWVHHALGPHLAHGAHALGLTLAHKGHATRAFFVTGLASCKGVKARVQQRQPLYPLGRNAQQLKGHAPAH